MESSQASEPLLRDISDTARWSAVFRARESEREDALFRDPFAKELAGWRGEQITDTLTHAGENAWAWVMRTYLFDRLIEQQINGGVDTVVNLAAGLDARPYRMDLPASLRWIEVDLPQIISYKEQVLAKEKPVCRLERVAVDLADRREFLTRRIRNVEKVMFLSEGLLIYFTGEQVAELATDLSGTDHAQFWILDLASPVLAEFLTRTTGQHTNKAGAPYKFAPAEGPEFFVRYGWNPVEVQSIFNTAAELKRLPPELQPLAEHLPADFHADQMWSGVCLFQNVSLI